MENTTLTSQQVWDISNSMSKDLKVELVKDHPEVNKYEIRYFVDNYLNTRIRAIVCTLTNTAYEDIVEVVHDKLNLDDLFDNRQEYLN